MRLAIVTGLTLLRVIAAGAIAAVLWPKQAWMAIFLLLVISFATDMFDGMLARRWQVVSWFGKIADPLADKVICLTVLWLLALHTDALVLLLGAMIITIYDITTMTLRFTTRRAVRPVAAASMVAKVKTMVLMVSLCLLVLSLAAASDDILYAGGIVLLILACALSLWSLALYLGQTFGVASTGAKS